MSTTNVPTSSKPANVNFDVILDEIFLHLNRKVPSNMMHLHWKITNNNVEKYYLLYSAFHNIKNNHLEAAVKDIGAIYAPSLDLDTQFDKFFQQIQIMLQFYEHYASAFMSYTIHPSLSRERLEALCHNHVSASKTLMKTLKIVYPTCMHFVLLGIALLVAYSADKDNFSCLPIEGLGPEILEKINPAFFEPGNVILNFFLRFMYRYLKHDQKFLDHMGAALGVCTAGKGSPKQKRLDIHGAIHSRFSTQLKQCFHMIPYFNSSNSTAKHVHMNDDAIEALLTTFVYQDSIATQHFFKHDFPYIISKLKFPLPFDIPEMENSNKHSSNHIEKCKELNKTYSTLMFFPRILCLTTNSTNVFCIERAFHFKSICMSNKNDRERVRVGTSRLAKVFRDLMTELKEIPFISNTVLQRLLQRKNNSVLFEAIKGLLNHFKSTEESGPFMDIISRLQAWFASSFDSKFKDLENIT